MRLKYLIVICSLLINTAFSQTSGIRGIIISEKGDKLPFAEIYIKNLSLGSSSNAEGGFELKLPNGTYQVFFRSLGYKTEEQSIEINNNWVELNIILKTTSYTLAEVSVNKGNEDPAYSIMRKAISMAKFYKYQVEEYKAKAYIKGYFKFKHIPFKWLVKKLDKENNIDTNKLYLDESVNEVSFKQPNIYKEKVLSVSSNQNESRPSPARYWNGSFYDPTIGGAISPLSPRAFAYYNFKLEGSYYEGKNEINKIKVMPKSNGDNLFRGYIYILDDLWSIQSINLTTVHEGITVVVTQLYTEVVDKIWMPLTQSYVLYGSYLGFGFDAKYQVVLNNYKITVNNKLKIPEEIIDEKTEKEKIPEKSVNKNEVEQVLKSNSKITRKDMQKLMKLYEKSESKKAEEPEVISNRTIEIDSMAYKRDSSFWANERLIQLSPKELDSYKIKDSISLIKVQKQKSENDTSTSTVSRNSIGLLVCNFKIDSLSSVKWHTPLSGLNFNTVEGYVMSSRLTFSKIFSNTSRLNIFPTARYSFGRNLFSGMAAIDYQYGSDALKGNVLIEGGLYVSQYNSYDPIKYSTNSISTLVFESNFMKLYEKEFYHINWSQNISNKLTFSFSGEYANRFMLSNFIDAKPYIDWDKNSFQSNNPISNENLSTGFKSHQSLITKFSLNYSPWKKYYIRNGVKKEVRNSSPQLSVDYTKGISGFIDSKVDFDLIEIGSKMNYKIGARGKVSIVLNAGSFLNTNKMYFMDYKHFMGNESFVQFSETGFRMLKYYTYSTNKSFAEAMISIVPAKFLFTQLTILRMLGLKEMLIVNYLQTPTTNNYLEIGYGLDNIFRFLRLEVVSTFQDLKQQNVTMRFGFNINSKARIN